MCILPSNISSTLHALDHASRLAETAGEEAELGTVNNRPDDVRIRRPLRLALRDRGSANGWRRGNFTGDRGCDSHSLPNDVVVLHDIVGNCGQEMLDA